ncbi:wall-associated receptor kinase-like 6 [Cornus florida]|uniref:wall-associated receptor kinase-like 6 n=1 Tax=Cornus florida TaxID=4283 RepID=UPI00289B8E0A|nr:wall-associated receptor kinase-like 6 [Cornus florida]
MAVLQILMLLLLVKETRSSSASNYSMAKPNCQEKCGNLKIPYPFGIGKGCYLNHMFEVTCNHSSHSATVSYLGNEAQVFNISMDYLLVDGPASARCRGKRYASSPLSYKCGQPFSVSGTQNKLVAVGCNIFAYITEFNTTNYVSGCASLCNDTTTGFDVGPFATSKNNLSSCSGIDCCQINIPEYLSSFDLLVGTIQTEYGGRGYRGCREPAPCSIAFIAEKNFSEFNKFNPSGNDTLPPVPLVLDWAIQNISCHEARRRKDYACSPNSNCTDFVINDAVGYRCSCSPGYQGNPYLNNGCQDINECEDPKNNPCPKGALCNNTEGNYSCTCPPGYHSIDGNGIGCIPEQAGRQILAVIVPLGVGIAVMVLVVIVLWLYRKFKKNKIKRQFFRRNGGLLLQQQISAIKERAAKIKLFLADELEKATDNFDQSRVLGKGGHGTVYKGMLSDGSIVAIKKSNIIDEKQVGQFINEVIILSYINHRNIVKLLGCCLEREVPLLVYEYVSNGTLSHHLHEEDHAMTMSWNTRLRIAREVAGALAYLHSYASTSIIHRDIKSSNILLDENYRAIVSDFGLSRSLSLTKTHLTTLVGGTFGYLDPEYFRSGQLTDKSDVYAFGVVVAELLTGKKAVSSDISNAGLVFHFRSSMEENRLFEILEAQIVNDGQQEEIVAVAKLAKRCIETNGSRRPSMKEVEAELDQLRRIQEQLLLKHDSQNSYCSVSERSYSCSTDAVEEESREEEFVTAANLAKRCIKRSGSRRPSMKEVADPLRRIQEQPLLKHNSLGSYCLVSEGPTLTEVMQWKKKVNTM